MGIMGLSEMLDRAADILRKQIKTIALYGLCYGLLYMVLIFVLIFGGGIFIAISTAIFPNLVLPAITIALTVVVIGVMGMASKVGIIKVSSQEFSDEKIGLGEALGASFKNLHKILGLLLIQVLLFTPAGAVFGGIIYFIVRSIESSIYISNSGRIPLIIITVLTVLVFLFVLQIYNTLFSFSIQSAVIEKMGIIKSINRSFKLVKNNFWRIFGITFLIGLITYGIQSSLTSFITLVLSVLYLLIKLLNLPLDYITFINMTFSVANWPITIISWLIIGPMATIMTTLLYYNQRFKKEGYDMVLRLRSIEKNNEGEQSSEPV